MALTCPLPLSKGTEVLKGIWNKKQLGDVSLDLFFSVIIDNFHISLVSEGNPWSEWDGDRSCS